MPGILLFLIVLGITMANLFRAHAVTTSEQGKSMTAAYLLAMVVMVTTGVFLSFAYVRYAWIIIGLSSVAAQLALQPGDDGRSTNGTPPGADGPQEAPA